MTLGVPRVKEVIHAVQNPKAPTMDVYLDDIDTSKLELVAGEDREQKIVEMRMKNVLEMKMNLQGTKIKHIIVSDETNVFNEKDTLIPPFSTKFEDDRWWVRLFYTVMFNGAIDPSVFSHNIIRLVLDEKKLQKRGLTVNSVANHLRRLLGDEMLVLHSDINSSKPTIRLRIIYDKPPNDDDDRVDEAKFMKQYLRQHLKEFILCGAPNIENSFIEKNEKKWYNPDTKEVSTKTEWYIVTEGTDLKRVLNWNGVDHTRTVSNNPMEIMDVLGIEATRQSIILEIQKVMKFYGIAVNYRHLSLLADTMTGRGSIMAINRHGINRTDASPLKKCTFEETVDMLLDAGKDYIYDDLKAVSSNIIVGNLARLGTGMFSLKWDGDNRKQSTPRRGISKLDKIRHENRKQRRKTSTASPVRENLFNGRDSMAISEDIEDDFSALMKPVVEMNTTGLFGGMDGW